MKLFNQPSAIWLIPIRVFLGYSWLSEGIIKARGDWLNTVILSGKATEADTSASVTEAGIKYFRIISDNSPAWFEWLANRIVLPNAFIFQIILVTAELLIGFTLIVGAFTFISGLVSMGLVLVLALSSNIYETAWWYIPASFCMLGGAGMTFGADYYIMPFLKKYFNSLLK